MADQDIRWKQRLANFHLAFGQLEQAVAEAGKRSLSDLEKQGMIQAFEFTHELAWNVLKDYFTWQGNPNLTGSRDAVREAFRSGLVADGEGWMAMIQSRNQSSHTYNRATAEAIVQAVTERYHPLFLEFARTMDALAHGS